MTGLTLKLKTKDGQHVVKTEGTSTVGILKTKIFEVTGWTPGIELQLLHGFPPKPLICDDDKSLDGVGIKNGDILIVEEKPMSAEEKQAKEAAERLIQDEILAAELAAQSEAGNEGTGIMMKQEVPADNSCLFTSIGFVMTGKIDVGSGSFMRQIIASEVTSDPETYNQGFLGRENAEYAAWIQQDDNWGGAIEVSILSKFYGIEFDVVDITNVMINRFGEDQNYGSRAFLLFDGIHYDPIYLESLTGEPPKTIFPIEDQRVYEQALQLANEAKSSRQFTDVQKFSLKCMQCNIFLKVKPLILKI